MSVYRTIGPLVYQNIILFTAFKIGCILHRRVCVMSIEGGIPYFSDEEIQGMDVQIADQSGKPLQLPPAEKRVHTCLVYLRLS